MSDLEKASTQFNKGLNCSQSIIAKYADKYNLDVSTACKLATGFGGGMGRQGNTCGALTGAYLGIAYLLLLMHPLLWSGNFVVGRAYVEQISPITFSFQRWILAAIILTPFVIKSVWHHRQQIKNHFGSILVLSVTGVSAF